MTTAHTRDSTTMEGTDPISELWANNPNGLGDFLDADNAYHLQNLKVTDFDTAIVQAIRYVVYSFYIWLDFTEVTELSLIW